MRKTIKAVFFGLLLLVCLVVVIGILVSSFYIHPLAFLFALAVFGFIGYQIWRGYKREMDHPGEPRQKLAEVREPVRWRFNSPPPSKEQERAKNPLVRLVFVIALIAAGIWLVPKALPSVTDRITQLLPFDCYIGYKGQAASITVSGLMAGQVCDHLVKSNSQFYRMSQAPTQPMVCERTIQEQRVIVRDEGFLKLIGNQICNSMDTYR